MCFLDIRIYLFKWFILWDGYWHREPELSAKNSLARLSPRALTALTAVPSLYIIADAVLSLPITATRYFSTLLNYFSVFVFGLLPLVKNIFY